MGSYTTGTGQRVTNVHPYTGDCDRYGCTIHAPSEHSMDDLPTHLRENLLMERICEHGVGHPDPDSVGYFERSGVTHMGVHGCDGCCSPEARAQRDLMRRTEAAAKELVNTPPGKAGDSLADALRRRG